MNGNSIPSNATHVNVMLDALEATALPDGADAAEVVEAIEHIGRTSLVVEKYQNNCFFLAAQRHRSLLSSPSSAVHSNETTDRN